MKLKVWVLTSLVWACTVAAQAPIAIDLNNGVGPPVESTPAHMIARADGVVLFNACTPESGCELWRSNGTALGTVMVADLHPGPIGSQPFGFGKDTPGSIVYFSAEDGTHGRELWRTDGTAVGTRMLADIEPGVSGSEPRNIIGLSGSNVIFAAGTVSQGRELYRSDGVSATLVVDLFPGNGSGVSNNTGGVPDLTQVGTRVVFAGFDGMFDSPFLTDGTAAGTVRLGNAFGPRDFTAYGTGMVFVGDSLINGRELYRSDFTSAGTVRVSDLRPGSNDGVFYVLGVGGSSVLVAGSTGVNNGVELFGFNGTVTALVRELNSGAANGLPEFPIFGGFVSAGGLLYFAGTSAAEGEELWRSDGSLGGTVRVAELLPGAASSEPRALTAFTQGASSRVLFVPGLESNSSAGPLFITDGTPGGLVNLNTFKNTDPGFQMVQVGQGAGAFLMFGALGSSPQGEAELWRSDGTPGGTALLADIAGLNGSSSPSQAIVAGSRAFFSAFETATGRELYVSRGTAASTSRVADLAPGTQSSLGGNGGLFDQTNFVGIGLGTRLVYMADTPGFGSEPHVTDGSAPGTVRLVDANPGVGGSTARGIAVAGARAFLVLELPSGAALFATDGTPGGTAPVTLPCTLQSDPQITAVGTHIYLRCSEPATGEELYRLDSATLAVIRVADLIIGPDSSSLTLIGAVGRPAKLAFVESSNGSRLFVTDGTGPGSLELNADPARDYKLRPPMIDGDGATYLRGRDAGGERLFRINPAMTLIAPVLTYPGAARPEQIEGDTDAASQCSALLGDAADGQGFDLLRFNMLTQSGGFVAPALQPGIRSAELDDLISMPGNDRFFASALVGADGALGVELLRMDGNGSALAVNAIDIAVGAASSAPRNFAMLGQQLLFSAYTAAGGRELYVVPAPDRIFGHGLNDGCGLLP